MMCLQKFLKDNVILLTLLFVIASRIRHDYRKENVCIVLLSFKCEIFQGQTNCAFGVLKFVKPQKGKTNNVTFLSLCRLYFDEIAVLYFCNIMRQDYSYKEYPKSTYSKMLLITSFNVVFLVN